jgi:hypothetical protein
MRFIQDISLLVTLIVCFIGINNAQSNKCMKLDKKAINDKCIKDFLPRYYYNHDEPNSWERCQFFWYGGCPSIDKSLVFESEHDCYASCGENSNFFYFITNIT